MADLAANRPGASLQAQIDAAHAAGQRATFLRRIFLGKHARSSWERGAIGERLVAAELEKLQRKDARWLFLHSIPVGSNDSDIDHVLIGPGGVFTINSKNHDGMKVWVGGNTFMVNGVRQPHIRNSRYEASRASKLLTKATGFDVSVRGVVVPVNADTFVVKAAPEDVTVINRNRLVKHLRRLPERLAQNTVEAVFEQACRSTTWLPLPGGAREHPSC
ncbi:NERD domain-containing protein [Tessaracoccus sp. MC1865]|nr:NERD domain-containing protein [Tessaracoccus sp. MC1865]